MALINEDTITKKSSVRSHDVLYLKRRSRRPLCICGLENTTQFNRRVEILSSGHGVSIDSYTFYVQMQNQFYKRPNFN